jgi:hypothetical protein
MLTLNLSPVRSNKPQPSVTYVAPVLTVNNISYDLSELPEGATAKHPVLGTVERSGNDYELTLLITHGFSAPESTRFPEPLTVTVDGPVELPLYNTPEPEVQNDLA